MFIREQCLYQKSTVEPGGGCLRDEKISAGGGSKTSGTDQRQGVNLIPRPSATFSLSCHFIEMISAPRIHRFIPGMLRGTVLRPSSRSVCSPSYLPCLLTCLCLSFETSLRIFALSNNGRPGGFAWQQRISVRGTGRVPPFFVPLLPRSPLNPNISSHVPPYS